MLKDVKTIKVIGEYQEGIHIHTEKTVRFSIDHTDFYESMKDAIKKIIKVCVKSNFSSHPTITVVLVDNYYNSHDKIRIILNYGDIEFREFNNNNRSYEETGKISLKHVKMSDTKKINTIYKEIEKIIDMYKIEKEEKEIVI